MSKSLLSLICILLISSLQTFADPPEPKKGFRWVLNPDYSDEFNGTLLNKKKWRDSFDGWKGRRPAKFVPSTVSVKNGNMQIKNAVLSPESDGYNIAGGAVQSLKDQAYYSYYECRFKASKIMMSTTFWMSNKKVPLLETTDCTTDKYSQELDIVEVVGGRPNSKFENNMNSNTHYRHISCGATKEVFHSAGSSTALSSKVWEDYHTYACWWVDANKVMFYADDQYTSTVHFNTDIDGTEPFDRPMKINMVTETYDWATPYPSATDLNNDAINTSYYDWIRSYKLVPIDEEVVVEEPGDAPSITNAGFETGSLSGWLSWGGHPIEVVDSNQNSGDYALHLVGGGAPEQVLTLKPNTEYTLSCYAKIVSGNINLGVKEGASGTANFTESTYTKKSFNFTTDGTGKVKIYFYAQGNDDEGYVDDFEIEETNPVVSTPEVVEIFTEEVKHLTSYIPEHTFTPQNSYDFAFSYKANTDRELHIRLLDSDNNLVGESTHTVLAGYGNDDFTLSLNSIPADGYYTMVTDIRPLEGAVSDIISTTELGMVIGEPIASLALPVQPIEVFPNPAQHTLTIKNGLKNMSYMIVDLLGKEMKKGVLNEGSISVDFLPNGIYFLKLENNQVVQFVKE